MEQKAKPRSGIIGTLTLVLIAACILMVLVYQTQQVIAVMMPGATPTIIPPSTGDGRGIDIEEEDHSLEPTPTMNLLAPG